MKNTFFYWLISQYRGSFATGAVLPQSSRLSLEECFQHEVASLANLSTQYCLTKWRNKYDENSYTQQTTKLRKFLLKETWNIPKFSNANKKFILSGWTKDENVLKVLQQHLLIFIQIKWICNKMEVRFWVIDEHSNKRITQFDWFLWQFFVLNCNFGREEKNN